VNSNSWIVSYNPFPFSTAQKNPPLFSEGQGTCSSLIERSWNQRFTWSDWTLKTPVIPTDFKDKNGLTTNLQSNEVELKI